MHIDPQERDEVLLWRSSSGDEGAFTELYRRHQGPLFRFALRMTGNAWAAEEIVQDVFMTLVRNPKKYEAERGTVGAFLYGVARNRIMKHLERAPRDLQLPEHGYDSYGALPQTIDLKTPAHSAELTERRERVRAAVMELPAEFREAVVLCLLEEMSYEDAARMLDCPIGTIRSRLYRGRALLLAKLEILREVPKRAIASR
ncbi:MAG TPA: sigma-70 family RNA polymerase sigma factor [Candidatus Acidoferrum sp.]|nr:sigma-70 family RNA polymerase sigma factor [Candidatus Acidoferrum sp.]